jgi:hypothetical protein
MNILQRAQRFVESWVNPGDPRRCPYCRYGLTKKHGTYPRPVRLLGGVKVVRVQRYWCHRCGRSYSPPDRRWARYARYGREVQRKALDMYFHVGGSLRATAEWLRGEVAPGQGRSRHWCPWRRAGRADRPGAHLSHVTVWRWEMAAGQRAAQRAEQGAWAGVSRFSGGVVADGTAVCIRGVWRSAHVILELGSRVAMQLERLTDEGETYLAGRFRAWLARWGLKWQQVKGLVSDGAGVYYGVLRLVLRQAQQQRCLFHLWRNLLPELQAYQASAGEQAGMFVRFALKALLAAPNLADAYVSLEDVERTFGHLPALQGVLRTLRHTLPELWGLVEAGFSLRERTSNIAERFFRRFKQRIRRMGNFMSDTGADQFMAVWLVYVNCEPYQLRRERKRHYCYPGQSPLAIGQADLQGCCWLDLLEV